MKNLMTIDSQWLFMTADTNDGDMDLTMEIGMAVDGNNIAFIYNTSSPTADASCLVRTCTRMRPRSLENLYEAKTGYIR